MIQYHELLQAIKERGTYKPPAREGMPGTTSLFGYQFRHNLQEGFPLLTTKKMFWKGVVVELLWFLRGDANIKYLVDNGVSIWNEDAYNYYLKVRKEQNITYDPLSFEDFITRIKTKESNNYYDGYKLGDCGRQYGEVWRNFGGQEVWEKAEPSILLATLKGVDQIKNVITSLKKNPEGRRHIVTAIDPAHDTDLALYWCHALFQFNCRPLTNDEILDECKKLGDSCDNMDSNSVFFGSSYETSFASWKNCPLNPPLYRLDCQLYQRSADVFLGVPFNIASYALLTHIIAKICNMIPGEFIHTFGDVHIYDNHKEQVDEQLKRVCWKLPRLEISNEGNDWTYESNSFDFSLLDIDNFQIKDYAAWPAIKAELSTGLKK